MSRKNHESLKVTLVVLFATLSCGAVVTKHYSFTGGYPSGAVSAGRAQSVESGCASIAPSGATTRRQRIVCADKTLAGRVTKVFDGDTILMTPNGGRGVKVRLRRIDAPEFDQPGGEKATAFLKELLKGKSVEVKYAERDDYGRVLGTVFFKSDKGLVDANLTMILNGWAWYYPSSSGKDDIPAYDKAEKAARSAKVGVWSMPSPIRPYDWRKTTHNFYTVEPPHIATKEWIIPHAGR